MCEGGTHCTSGDAGGGGVLLPLPPPPTHANVHTLRHAPHNTHVLGLALPLALAGMCSDRPSSAELVGVRSSFIAKRQRNRDGSLSSGADARDRLLDRLLDGAVADDDGGAVLPEGVSCT